MESKDCVKKIVEMNVCEPWFTYLMSGCKPIEGRKASLKWSKLTPGMTLKLISDLDQVGYVKITSIHRYPSLEAYLKTEGVDRCLPGVRTLKDAVAVYSQWSTAEELAAHDFLGICVERL